MAKTKKRNAAQKADDGWRLFFKRKFDDALDLFNSVLETEEDFYARYGRACASLRVNNIEVALNDLSELLNKDGSNIDYLHTRALAYGADEQYDKAMKDLNRVLYLIPANGEAWCDLGGIYLIREDFAKARDCFERAADIDKACSCAWLGKGIAALFFREYRKASEYLNISIKLEAKVKTAYLARAEAFFSNNKKKEALKDVKKALTLDRAFFEEFKTMLSDQPEKHKQVENHKGDLNDEDAIVY